MPIKHIIEAGDSVTSLADQFGHFVDTIWNDPANAALKQKRKNMDILLIGDVLVIPDKRLKELSKPAEKKHGFRRKGVPAIFRMQVFDRDQPRGRQDYTFTVDGRVCKGTTDGDGVMEETISPQAREGQLIIGPDHFEVIVKFGHLDPVSELSGIQKRLNNLGFDCGEPDGEMRPQTEGALRSFQRRFKLQETGKADAATGKKLEEVHENVGSLSKDK